MGNAEIKGFMKRLLRVLVNQYLGLILLLLVFVVFSKPYFFNGKIPYPSSHLVTLMPPWNSLGELSVPVKNNAMPDVVAQLLPWKYFTIQELKFGRIPLWNPYSFSGTSHLANYQSAVFSLTNVVFFLLPFIDAWTAAILLQVLIGGVGMYLYLRRIEVSQLGCAIGSISFMFCGFMVVWMAYGTLSLAVSFLPWMLYATESYLLTRSFRFIPLLIGGITFSLFSGHFQTSLYAILFAEIYAIFRIILLKRLVDAGVLGFSFIIGIALSIPQLLPTFQFYLESVRSSSSIVDKGIPFYYLITSIIPDFFGNPVTRNDWMSYYAERASFIGIIPFTLSLFALLYRRTRQTYFFFVFGIVSLILAVDSPLQSLLSLSQIPVLSSSNPTRIIVLFSFSFAVLSALGYDILLKLIKEKKLKIISAPLLGMALLLLVTFIFATFSGVLPEDKISIAIRNSALPLFSFVLFTIILGLYVVIKNKTVRLLLLSGILLLVSFESLRFATKWMPTDEKSNFYKPVPVIEALQKVKNEGRIFQALGAETSMMYGLRNIEGYDSLFLKRYAEFIQSAKHGKLENTERTTVRLDRDGVGADRVLDLLNVTTIFHPVSFNNQAFAYPVRKDTSRYQQIYKDDRFELYRNTTAQPRVKLFYNYEVISDKEEGIKRFYTKNFDFRNTILLERNPTSTINKEGSGSARIISETPTKIVIKAISTSPAILFLADPYFSQWKVKLNNKEATIIPAFHAFRAVEVPDGESTVVFYLPFF